MTVPEAALMIGLSSDAVYDLCKRSLLGHRRKGPNRGRIEITAAHVERYLQSCEVAVGEAGGKPRPAVRPKPARRGTSDVRSDGKPFRFTR